MALRRKAEAQLRAETRQYRRDLNKARKMTKGFAKDTKRSLIGGFKGGFGAIAALGTAGGIADIGRDVFGFEEGLIRLDIQAGGEADIAALRREATDLQFELGVSRTKSVQAAAALTNLLGGSAATAANMRVLTEIMVGTGAEMEDLAGLAQVMDQQFGLKGPEQLRAGLNRMIGVGKQGSVTLKDMSKVGKQSAAVFARIGDDGAAGVGQLAAALQIGERAFGTPAEGATALKAMVEGLEAATIKVPGLRKQIGQVGTEKFVGFEESLDRLATSTFFTDKRKFRRAFPSAPARNMITALIKNREVMDDFTKAGQKAEKENIGFADSQKFINSNAGQMKVAFAKIRGEIEKLFTPERVQGMIKAANAMGVALGFVIDNWELFLAGFLAIKAAAIGVSIFKWARAAKLLATNAGAAGKAIGAIPQISQGAGLPTKGAGLGTKLLGGAVAFGAGFEVGTAINEVLDLQTKTQEIARATGLRGAFRTLAGVNPEQKRRREERETQASEAFLELLDIGAISEEGIVDPRLVASLRRSQIAGRQLSSAELAAEQAITGGLETATGGALVRTQGGAFQGFLEAQREVITATPEEQSAREMERQEFDILLEQNRRALELQQEQLDATRAQNELLAGSRRIEIDGAVVADVTENNRQTRRRPAP